MSLQAVVDFSFKMISLLNGNEKCITFSPSSILNGLSMVVSGAKDATAEEILNILGKGMSKDEIIKYYSDLMKEHAAENVKDIGDVQVIYGNKLFVSEKVSLVPEFVNVINESFDGQIKKLDFTNKMEAVKEINSFVKKVTKGKIPEMTAPGQINPQTQLAIINALYFSGKWENIFENRKKLPFHHSVSSIEEIDFMYQRIFDEEQWNFNENEDWECLGIPYKNYEAWMFIVLPKEKNGLSKIIENLDYNIFMKFTKLAKKSRMCIIIPTFEISSSFSLNDKLKELGMIQAFESSCDLSGMMKNRSKIDEVLHKATIKVDEYGTEATAATMFTQTAVSGRRQFFANHPFLYFITTTENKNNIVKEILFIGTFC